MSESRLVRAVMAGDLPTAEEVLRDGADPNGRCPLGYPPLHLASALGRPQLVELLLTSGADPLLLDTRTGASALHRAAQSGVVDTARLLLGHGAFIDQQSALNGHTPLMDAVWHKRPRMAEFLLDQDADPELRSHGGYIALDMEALSADDDFTPYREAILRARRRYTARDREPLRVAALTGDLLALGEEVDRGADLDRRSSDGQTPLMDAVREGHTEAVALLLRAGADPRLVDGGKSTPAHRAGYLGHADVARLLVADPRLELDARAPYTGHTALHDAVWHGHTEAARVFVAAGARLDLRGLDGRTPLDMARDYGRCELVDLLEQAERDRASGPNRPERVESAG
ncbi:ankyrin repeat domain-containing protein [Allonocardiopsis opalescens]|uniref:Ankyrin repeat protein n=1 Tax=Allonocardiopsis opalescens TaxID=1144618 RepID=A0A2T0Q5C7_9ACTN|nr:ankyrin repeat domain-containing protein [Allonocardiopsis opalescens]PRX99028.1 ankyrin repeat protein [Allonocardiopsis opalescens]